MLNGISADVHMFFLSLNTSNKQVIKTFHIWNRFKTAQKYTYIHAVDLNNL